MLRVRKDTIKSLGMKREEFKSEDVESQESV